MSAAMEKTLRIMPREMRMMTERILSLTNLPNGFVLMASDLVMFSQALGLGGFALLERRFEALQGADPARLSVASEDGNALTLDASGEHAWVVVPTLVDLLGELAAHHETARITICGAMDPEELLVAQAVAARHALCVRIEGAGEPVAVASPAVVSGDLRLDEPVLWTLMLQGVAIDEALWWRVYHLAQKALTPDSPVSRRHAGPLIVNEDGSVTGRKDNDDETDFAFLTTTSDSENRTESGET